MTGQQLLVVKKPAQWLNSNLRLHWAERHRRIQAWKDATAWQVKAAGLAPYGDQPVRITAVIHKTRGGRWDAGNLYPTVKACVDALTLTGVISDDDNAHVIGPDLRAGDKAAEAHVVIILDPVEATS